MGNSQLPDAGAEAEAARLEQAQRVLGHTTENDLKQVLGCDEVNVVLLGASLGIRRMSGAAARLVGIGQALPPTTLDDLAEWWRSPELLTDARRALEGGKVTVCNLLWAERNMRLALRFYPCRTESGQVNGLLLSIADITARWNANSVARHLAAIVKYSDDAILSKDLNGIITSWNNGAGRLFGYTAEETIGQPVTILIPDGMPDEEPGILQRIRRGEAIDHYQTKRRRKDGSLIDVSLCVSPVLDDDGRVIGASKIARDVTDARRAEREREVLINELNHRVKNTMATVQSIAYHSLRYATTMDGFADSFNSRLLALSKTQNVLTTGNWIHAPLRDLVLNELAPYRNESNAVNLSGEDVQLPPRVVTPLGMLIHELTTNAVKYGALSAPGGHVDVSWQMSDGAGWLQFSWKETGGPPIAVPPTRKGMGSRLIETLMAGLGGTADLQFAPSGVCCVIEVSTKNEQGAT